MPRLSQVTPASHLDELYVEHGDWLRGMLGRRLRIQPADADDLVQDTYLRMAQRPATPVASPRGLLAQIATNLFRDSTRRKAVRQAHAVTTAAIGTPSPDRGLLEQEAAVALAQLVLGLPEPLRDVFVLSRFRHMTNRDIATHLGVSIKTVEWRMSRALDFCVGRLRD